MNSDILNGETAGWDGYLKLGGRAREWALTSSTYVDEAFLHLFAETTNIPSVCSAYSSISRAFSLSICPPGQERNIELCPRAEKFDYRHAA